MKKSTFQELYIDSNFLEAKDGKSVSDSNFDSVQKPNYKSSIFYQAHSYPTKIPVEMVAEIIRKNTKKGEVVMDPFCGSGMTGLAAALSGRKAVISDIGTLSLHLSANHIRKCNADSLRDEASTILSKVRTTSPYRFMFEATEQEIAYLVYSDVIECISCGKENIFWSVGVDPESLKVQTEPKCSKCASKIKRNGAKKVACVPAFVSFHPGGKKKSSSRPVTGKLASALEFTLPKGYTFPAVCNTRISANREMYIRSALHLQNVTTMKDFYTDRNLYALSLLYREILKVGDPRTRAALLFAFTNTAWHGSKMRRFNNAGGHRPLTGTLYFPTLYSEANVFDVFENKIDTLVDYYDALSVANPSSEQVTIHRSSAGNLAKVPTASVDYVFTDPPFGSNIFYADCNFLAEAWLGELTDLKQEAVVNRSLKPDAGGKSVLDYEGLMLSAFKEIRRVLKPTGKFDLVFNNSDGKIWSVILEKLEEAGFSVVSSSGLDKGQKSVKGYKGANAQESVATTDIVISMKPRKSRMRDAGKTEIDKNALDKAFTSFIKTQKKSDPRFIVSDFFSYFLQFCFLKGYSFEEIQYSKVKEFISQQSLGV